MSEFDRIIGYENIKAELKRFADVLKEPGKYTKLGVTTPSGILLYGAPGLGKTLMANCFVKETGCRVFSLRKEKPNGDFVNQIKETFEAAKSEAEGIKIVFLDDMDKFANEDDRHRNAEEYVAVQSCIDDCKGYGIFVFATVNDRDCLPDSLLRAGRFDKVIEVDAPRGKDAELIIRDFLNQKNITGNIDTEEISRIMEGGSCAELETVINEAGIYAGYLGKDKIEQSDVIKACMRMIFDAPETTGLIDRKYVRNIAVHEAGHAVVSEILEPGSVSLVSVCRYSGATEGVTLIRKPDDYKISKTAQEHEVTRLLGGKAATEMVYGLVDMGTNNDLRGAFNLVTEFIDDYCSYGFDAFERNNSSGYLLEKRDRMVADEINKYYGQAKQVIAENRAFLDMITQGLVEKKTLTRKDIEIIRDRVAETEGKCYNQGSTKICTYKEG